ncbi:MAG: alpha/beta fold hydrolase [Blastocatellia bacterium]
MDRFAQVNGIRLHYLDHGGDGPALVLLPGLTANAHAFDGLILAGLGSRFRVLALDLRGRGLSDKPATGYSMPEHAADVIALLDALGVGRAVMCGHSFGGLLTLYLAACHPDRVKKLVIIDSSAMLINPRTRELIKPSLDRLGKSVPSWGLYLEAMKRAPFFTNWWDPAIESYFRADVEMGEDGAVRPRSRPDNIAEAMDEAGKEDWPAHMAAIRQPAILFHAPGAYGRAGAPPIVTLEQARATADALTDCRYVEVPGNHITMLYGEGARRIVEGVTEFARED